MYSLTSCRYHPVSGGGGGDSTPASSSFCILHRVGGKLFTPPADARVWLLLNSAFGSKLCNLLHLSAAAARRELLLFLGAMMMVVLLLVHVLHRRPNVVLNRERERRKVLNFLRARLAGDSIRVFLCDRQHV